MIDAPGPLGSGSAPGFPRVIIVTARAARQFRKLPTLARDAMSDALERYAATGFGDVTRLAAVRPPEYRLRVGDYRARFSLTVAHEGAVVEVLWVGHRREAY